MDSPAALYCVVWKDNCSNMSAVSYGLVKCELCLYWINIYYIYYSARVCGPCVAHWPSVEE
jgi:hypothetical protein